MVWGWIASGISEEIVEELYEKARAGDSAPGWFKATMPSPAFALAADWDEDNPVWHLWNWMGSPTAGEGAGVALEQFPDLRTKMQERWMVDFWIPLYTAACDLSFPDYAASLKAIFPTVQQVYSVYGRDFVSPWYADVVELEVGEMLRFKPLSAEEYLSRRAELGCEFTPIANIPALFTLPKTFPWTWAAFGTLVIGAAVATTLYVKNQPKRRRRRKKR